MFNFSGNLLYSKSWLNRAQIIYFYSGKKFPFVSQAEDVIHLQKAISAIGSTDRFYLGQGGTSLRFFILLISRIPGTWKVTADESLLQRPQLPLQSLLAQLGVNCEFSNGEITITGRDWKVPEVINCNAEVSSQFISGLLLNSWNLETELSLLISRPLKSRSFLDMTLHILKRSGMMFSLVESELQLQIKISPKQRPSIGDLKPELDVSSAFSLAAAAVVGGSAKIQNWTSKTLQPDLAFLQAFDQMKISYEISESVFNIVKHKTWYGCEMNLENCPDLFPVLSALCALGEGKSKLFGAEHLRHKESDRITKTAELLQLFGVKFEELSDGLIIYGKSFRLGEKELTFDPSEDHRMAMAAGLFKLYGFNIEILHRNVVNKSYPDFWKDTGL
jgi:3-phosphoshikimate 1-carboxyvinyltransferase